ncbi:MAG: hypothetical protein AAF571_03470 [Verrucomicrobiota bacterium]
MDKNETSTAQPLPQVPCSLGHYYSKWKGRRDGKSVTRYVIDRNLGGGIIVVDGRLTRLSGYAYCGEKIVTLEEFKYWAAMHRAKCVESLENNRINKSDDS